MLFFCFLQFKAFWTYFLAMRMVFEHRTPFTYSSISANSNSVSGNNRPHKSIALCLRKQALFFVFLFFLLLLDLFFMLFDFNGKKQPVNLKLTLKNIPWKMGRCLFTELWLQCKLNRQINSSEFIRVSILNMDYETKVSYI